MVAIYADECRRVDKQVEFSLPAVTCIQDMQELLQRPLL